MKCPHCAIHIHEDWQEDYFGHGSHLISSDDISHKTIWRYRSMLCPQCRKYILQYCNYHHESKSAIGGWKQLHPFGVNRGPIHSTVPSEIAKDYNEACAVLSLSPKASAALSRRCLQAILHSHGYRDRDLNREIDLLLNEPDPQKALTSVLRQTVDAIRNFGNFSAHPIDDKTTLQIIDVDPEEAEWCLEIIEAMFHHFYEAPSLAAERKAKLDAKLAAARKPPSKTG